MSVTKNQKVLITSSVLCALAFLGWLVNDSKVKQKVESQEKRTGRLEYRLERSIDKIDEKLQRIEDKVDKLK